MDYIEVRRNARNAFAQGASVKTIRSFLKENEIMLVAWQNSGGHTYMALQETGSLQGIEFEPENDAFTRADFDYVLGKAIVEI